MAIQRIIKETIAAVEVNDQYGVDLTIHSRREHLTRSLSPAEAIQLAGDLVEAAHGATRAAAEDGAE